MSTYFEYLQSGIEDPKIFVQKILITIAFFVIAHLIYRLLSFLIDRYVSDGKKTRLFTRIIRLIIIIISLLLFMRIWFSTKNSLIIAVGIVLAIVSLSLKDLIVNIAGWAYMNSTKIIEHDDLVEIDGVSGHVVDIDLFEIYLSEVGNIIDSATPTGRMVSVPNRFIFEHKLYNSTRDFDFVWNEAYVTIPFDFDRDEALEVAGKAIYDEYLGIMEEYDKEDMERIKKMSDMIDATEKPQIRAQYDVHGCRIYVKYLTPSEDTGKNAARMHFALVDSFMKHDVPIITPKWIRYSDD